MSITQAHILPSGTIAIEDEHWSLALPAELLIIDAIGWLEKQRQVRLADAASAELDGDHEFAKELRSQAEALERALAAPSVEAAATLAELDPPHRNRLRLPLSPHNPGELASYARSLVQFGERCEGPPAFCLMVAHGAAAIYATATCRQLLNHASPFKADLVTEAELEEVIRGL